MKRSFVVLLCVAACDSTLQANPGDACPGVCQRVVECNLPNAGVDVCNEFCEDEVQQAGPAGQTVTAGCLQCLQAKGCNDIVNGGCASLCPDSLFDGNNPCDTGQKSCGGTCVDTQTNLKDCGACGVTCATLQVCALGVCTAGPCVANGCGGLSWCDTGVSQCKPGCERDDQCGTNEQCDLTPHACECKPGFHSCAGACVADDDINACGASCTVCSPPAQASAECSMGSCSYVCDPGLFHCDSGCCTASAIAAGGAHSCALLSDQTVRCWGRNDNGQLGDGSGVDQWLPTPVPGLSGPTAISAGAFNTCAVTTGGGLQCWGFNQQGQLGDGSTSARPTPVAVVGFSAGAAQAQPGYDVSCAVTNAGAAKCWGDDMFGELGDGSMMMSSASPVSVMGLTPGVKETAPGDDFACAVTGTSGVKCWGYGEAGQLGDGLSQSHLAPTDVSGLTSGVKHVMCGDSHCCALLTSGAVKCWGDNEFGQLGDGSMNSRPAPVDVSGLSSGVVMLGVAASGAQGCALTSAGVVKCWGTAMGIPQMVIPQAVMGFPANTVAVATGGGHVCGLTADGRVLCQGTNDNGQLGDGTKNTSMSAVFVSGRGQP